MEMSMNNATNSQEKLVLNLSVVRVDPREQSVIAAGLFYNKV
jgi:hypothetical protein